jgi:hypothetical protein
LPFIFNSSDPVTRLVAPIRIKFIVGAPADLKNVRLG